MDLEKLIEQITSKVPYAKLVGISVKARWGAVFGLPVLIIVLFYFLSLQAIFAKTTELNEELAQVQNEVQIKQSLEIRLPALVKEIEAKDYELTLLRRQLPEKKEIPNLLQDISDLGTQSGLEFITFRPLPEQVKDFYAEVPVQLNILGKFHNILTFFDRVSRMPRIVTIADLDIQKTDLKQKNKAKKGAFVLVSTKAVTFRFIEAVIDKPAVEEKK